MRSVQQAVTVTLTAAGAMQRLTWRGRTYPVGAVLDQWRYGGRWWLGESPRSCYLVQAGELVAELHHEAAPDRWWLARIQD